MTDFEGGPNPRGVSYEGAAALSGLEDRPQETGATAEAFRLLYEREFEYVLRTLRRLGIRQADVEDLVHEVFIVVHRRLGDYDPGRPIRPWLFGIAYRVASDHRRRAHVQREVGVDVPDATCPAPGPEALAQTAQARDLVLSALTELDLPFRAALVLHDLDGCTAPEIARVLEIPLNTVYSRVRLAREKFAAAVTRRSSRGKAR